VNDFLLAAQDQHTNGGIGVGGIVFVCVILWLLLGGGGPKKK
jgi:hypothetical protein